MDKMTLNILLKYLANHLYLEYDKKLNVWNIVLSELLFKPASSNWYNHKRRFLDLNLKIEKFVSLSEGEQERFELNFSQKESTVQYYSIFSFYSIFKDNLFYIQNKEDCKALSYYGIEDAGDRVRLSVGKETHSSSIYYSKTKLLKLFKDRYNGLLKLKKVLEAPKMKNPKAGKLSYYYNEFSKSIKEIVFTDSDILFFKALVCINASNHLYPVHAFIDNVAKLIGSEVKDSCRWTIDNGWGSYTYTSIRNVVSLDKMSDEYKAILHFAWAYYKKNNNLKSSEAERYIEMTNSTLGMVLSSGGYTHISG